MANCRKTKRHREPVKPPRVANNGSEHCPLYDAHTHSPPANGSTATLSVLNGTRPADWPQVATLADRASPLVAAHTHVLAEIDPSASDATEPRPNLIPSYGLHPWYCANAPSDWLAQLRARLLADPRAQVGEIGIDRALLRRSNAAPIETQLAALNAQLALAAELNRVATLHCVQAHGLLLETLHNAPKLPRLLLHAYSGSAQLVKSFATLGAYFSFGADILDPRRARLREALHATPPDRLLSETDTPTGTNHQKRSPTESPLTSSNSFLYNEPHRLTRRREPESSRHKRRCTQPALAVELPRTFTPCLRRRLCATSPIRPGENAWLARPHTANAKLHPPFLCACLKSVIATELAAYESQKFVPPRFS